MKVFKKRIYQPVSKSLKKKKKMIPNIMLTITLNLSETKGLSSLFNV